MHSYLRSIGFSKIKTKKQLEAIYHEVTQRPNRKIITTVSSNTSLIQFEKDFGNSIGITIIGELDAANNLSVEHSFPYLKGSKKTIHESITIEKQTDKESYAGVSEDSFIGMTLIFFLQNIADYAKSKWFNTSNKNLTEVKFSSLSIEGKILIGVKKDIEQLTQESDFWKNRNKLISEAKNGDENAIENLTIDELELYSDINKRLKKEDLLSIVDTSIMPCGVECDHYAVIGNILFVEKTTNIFTNEIIYNMLVDVNSIKINIAINSLDLLGEPAVGRRFKGEIWLQGHVKI